MRLLLAALAVTLLGAASPAIAQPAPDPLQAKVTAIRDRFVEAVKACGVKPAFEPGVEILSTPAVIAYDGDKRRLEIGRFQTLPPPIQGFFAQWAAHDMPGRPPEELFDSLFNGFLVAHELGHWVDDQSDRALKLDHYQAELQANRFAIAFAALDPETAPRRAQVVGRFSFLGTLPDPVPAGEDHRAWFNANYAGLPGRDPIAYNWFQGELMRQAWAMRDQADFCALVKGTT